MNIGQSVIHPLTGSKTTVARVVQSERWGTIIHLQDDASTGFWARDIKPAEETK